MVRSRLTRLLSLNVGQPREMTWRGKIVYTSVWKEPVEGQCGALLMARETPRAGCVPVLGPEKLGKPRKTLQNKPWSPRPDLNR